MTASIKEQVAADFREAAGKAIDAKRNGSRRVRARPNRGQIDRKPTYTIFERLMADDKLGEVAALARI